MKENYLINAIRNYGQRYRIYLPPLLIILTAWLFFFLFKLNDVPLMAEDQFRITRAHFLKSIRINILRNLGNFYHTPFSLIFNLAISSISAEVSHIRISYFGLKSLSIFYIYKSLYKGFSLPPLSASLTTLVLLSLPVVSYSLFSIDLFLLAYTYGLFILSTEHTRSLRANSLLYALNCFILEVGLIYPMASFIIRLGRERKFKSAFTLIAPSLIIILLWLILELSMSNHDLSWRERVNSNYPWNLNNLFRVQLSYLIYFINNFYLHLIWVAVYFIFFFKYFRLIPNHFLIILAATLNLSFYFIYGHFHPKDLIGSILLIFILFLTLIPNNNLNQRILFLLLICSSLFAWQTRFQRQYHSPKLYKLSLIRHNRLRMVLNDNYNIDLNKVSSSSDIALRLGLRNRSVLNKYHVVSMNELHTLKPLLLQQNFCPLHIFYYNPDASFFDYKIFDCKYPSLSFYSKFKRVSPISTYILGKYGMKN